MEHLVLLLALTVVIFTHRIFSEKRFDKRLDKCAGRSKECRLDSRSNKT